ncbi:hypothetical protein D3C74_282800 [compost metagenome]
MQTVANNERVLCSNLHVVARLKLAITHMIFFHSHECGVMIGLAEAVSIPENLLLGLVFPQTRQQVFTKHTYRLF